MINLSFPFVTCQRSMSGEYDPQFQLLQIETCTPKLMVKTTIEQEVNFELTSRRFVGHVNLSFANSQATIFRIQLGDCVWNASISSNDVLQRYTKAAWEQVFLARAWSTMSAMKTTIEIMYSPLKCRHMEGLSLSGLDRSWWCPDTSNYECGRSSPRLWQRDSQTSHHWSL